MEAGKEDEAKIMQEQANRYIITGQNYLRTPIPLV